MRQNKSLLNQSIVYITLTSVGALLNFGFYPISARFLGREDLSDLGILNAFILQLAAITVAMGLVTVGTLKAKDSTINLARLESLQSLVTKFFLYLILAFLVASPLIKALFHLQSYTTLLLLIPYALLSIPIMILSGLLQYRKAFGIMGIFTVTVAGIKLISAALLFQTGAALYGAIIAVILGQVAGLLFLIKKTRIRISFHWKIKQGLVDTKWVLSSIITIFILLLLTNVDVLLIKHSFPGSAWMYIGPALITNAIIFFSTSITYVMVSHITPGNRENSAATLQHTLLLWGLGIVSAAVVGFIFPETIIRLTAGSKYITNMTSGFVMLSTAFYSLVGLFYILVSYNLALKNTRVSWFAGLVLMVSFGVGQLFSRSITAIMFSLIVVAIIANITIYSKIRRNEKTT